MYLIYVLQSLKDANRFYVGLCIDLLDRLSEHNSGKSSHTAKHLPWKAEAFERYLKSGSGREFCRRHF